MSTRILEKNADNEIGVGIFFAKILTRATDNGMRLRLLGSDQ